MLPLQADEIYMPFPAARPNPAMGEAESRMWTWLDHFGLCQTDAARKRMETTQSPRVISMMYPGIDVELLAMISQYLGFFFVINDRFDYDLGCQDAASVGEVVEGLTSTLRGAVPEDSTASAFADLWQRLTMKRSDAWQARFRTNTEAWLWTYFTEAANRASGRVPTLREYQAYRIYSVQNLPYLDLCELAVGIDVPVCARQLPSHKALLAAATDFSYRINDAISVAREEVAGYSNNYVLLLQHHDGLSRADALSLVNNEMTESLQRMQKAERDFLQQLDTVRLPVAERRKIPQLITAYHDEIRGQFDWYFITDRYVVRTCPTVPS